MSKTPGSRLKQAMTDLNLTQQEVADALGVTRQSISLYLNEERPITKVVAYALAYTLKINPEWLMEGKGGMMER